ncbi:polysaccharide biosynthesis/export family protein [Sphingomonas glaciei]|uniref:Polysaccharide biosynthesis/export family protein n=1 Tax=Sphingomonas glaciei TaxID=2938948 RepID=A0ABY5MX80_9SPHN|nr:polysaccharide biosynthesis/export family protein [Sphingomonas glaciei]UUR06961.1 polysaccharide biosynthesis/export family protein [Sphingomonas glaciei]
MARINIYLALLLAIAFGGFGNTANAQQASQAAPTGVAYRINPGDEIDVLVWGDERLQRSVRVLPDGTFAFPLVGQVVAAGRLPSELERIITAGLQPQYRGSVPQVTVSVKNPTGFQFSVVGKVKGPGTFTPGRYVNALEALSIAGGATEFADLGNIRIIRKSGSDLLTIRVRIVDALRGSGGRLNSNDIPQILSGDTLVVP